MERQAPIYLGINKIKSIKERKQAIKVLRNTLEKMLKEGHLPDAYRENVYQENSEIDIQEAILLAPALYSFETLLKLARV